MTLAAQDKATSILLTNWQNPSFYLPIFGCVHAKTLEAKKQLIEDEFTLRIGMPFHPYDPHQRWYNAVECEVITDSIITLEDSVAIPVVTATGAFVYCYGQYTQVAANTFKSNLTFDKPTKFYWYSFQGEKSEITPYCHIYLQEFQKSPRKITSDIKEFQILPYKQQQTLAILTGEGTNWAKELYESLIKNKITSPVYCATHKGKITGVVGPLDIYKDIEGVKFLAPAYFAVDESYRRQGIGRALRLAMEAFAISKGAQYKLLQAKCGTPADSFYAQTGLRNVGKVIRF